jgi:hypothetical protein
MLAFIFFTLLYGFCLIGILAGIWAAIWILALIASFFQGETT